MGQALFSTKATVRTIEGISGRSQKWSWPENRASAPKPSGEANTEAAPVELPAPMEE
jgi:hypothetical protein